MTSKSDQGVRSIISSCTGATRRAASASSGLGSTPRTSKCSPATFRKSPRAHPASSSVHALVVRKVGTVFDIAYPVLVGAVPIDRRGEPGGEIDFRRPAPFAPDLRAIDGIAAVVARTIRHELDERFGLA